MRNSGLISFFMDDFFGKNLNSYLNNNLIEAPYDLMTDEKWYNLLLEVPGFSKKDINISYQNNKLKISGEIKENDKNFTLNKSSGKFENIFSLHNNINIENISAECVNGILKISIPFKEDEKPKMIEIT